MERGGSVFAGLAVAILLAAFATVFWFAQTDWTARPSVAPADSPANVFSAGRAEHVLSRILGPERAHPVSTSENAAVRARILKEFAALGVQTNVEPNFGCNAALSHGLIFCASVNDILAQIKPGTGKAILLMAHYDSVPAGPGAADDESSVASVIEAARALKAQGLPGSHPILALITDGEEAGLLGAAAFLHDRALRARVGAVVNAEARGNQGPSLLFQTSPGNGPLIDIYAQHVRNYAASSLYAEIYRFLPNDTDLTLFLRDGFPSFNFAFSGDVAQYHTALDTRADLDSRSLQQQGDNILGMAEGLEGSSFDALKGQDDIYVDLLGRVLPRAPQKSAIPLAVLALLLVLVAAFRTRGESGGGWIGAFAITPVLVIGSGLAGWGLHSLDVWLSGMPDPSYAFPTHLRIALSLGVAAFALFASRFAPARSAAIAVWLWIAVLGLAVAIFLPGLSPYFLIPGIIGGVLLIVAAAIPGGICGSLGQVALLLAAVPMLLLWIGFGASGENVMGLALHPLFTVPVAFAATALVPLLARHRLPAGALAVTTLVVLASAVGVAVLASREPAYSATAPQRLDITYVEQNGDAQWAVDALGPVPAGLGKLAHFDPQPKRVSPFSWATSYVAPAGRATDAPPSARLLQNRVTRQGRRVTLALKGSDMADQMFLIVPHPADLKAVDIKDWHFNAPASWKTLPHVFVACMSRDCSAAALSLTLSDNKPIDLTLGEFRFRLPAVAAPLVSARPKTAVPSQNGDGTLLLTQLRIPAA